MVRKVNPFHPHIFPITMFPSIHLPPAVAGIWCLYDVAARGLVNGRGPASAGRDSAKHVSYRHHIPKNLAKLMILYDICPLFRSGKPEFGRVHHWTPTDRFPIAYKLTNVSAAIRMPMLTIVSRTDWRLR